MTTSSSESGWKNSLSGCVNTWFIGKTLFGTRKIPGSRMPARKMLACPSTRFLPVKIPRDMRRRSPRMISMVAVRCVLAGRPNDQPERIELHGSINTRATREFFESECRERLPGCIPGGLVLLICRLRGRAGRETPHNRFILTDIGGVAFARGLDDGAEGEND